MCVFLFVCPPHHHCFNYSQEGAIIPGRLRRIAGLCYVLLLFLLIITGFYCVLNTNHAENLLWIISFNFSTVLWNKQYFYINFANRILYGFVRPLDKWLCLHVWFLIINSTIIHTLYHILPFSKHFCVPCLNINKPTLYNCCYLDCTWGNQDRKTKSPWWQN